MGSMNFSSWLCFRLESHWKSILLFAWKTGIAVNYWSFPSKSKWLLQYSSPTHWHSMNTIKKTSNHLFVVFCVLLINSSFDWYKFLTIENVVSFDGETADALHPLELFPNQYHIPFRLGWCGGQQVIGCGVWIHQVWYLRRNRIHILLCQLPQRHL